MPETLLHMLSSRSFMISSLTLNNLIHFEFILVMVEECGLILSFSHVSSFPNHLLNRAIFTEVCPPVTHYIILCSFFSWLDWTCKLSPENTAVASVSSPSPSCSPEQVQLLPFPVKVHHCYSLWVDSKPMEFKQSSCLRQIKICTGEINKGG